MDAHNLPTNAAELKAARVAIAEDSVAGVKAKIAKLEDHLAAARDALVTAEAELAATRDADHEFVTPTESVTVQAQ